MADLKQYDKQQYLNIETFRKNGVGVKTPVWFVQDGDLFYIWTESTSGKAKRIRNNGMVKIAPSKGDGTVIGIWAAAQATVDDSAAALGRIKDLMRSKYGFMFTVFGVMGKMRKSQYVALKVAVS